MEQETKNYIEEFMGKISKRKSRLCSILLSMFALICTVIYMITTTPGGIMVLYSFCIILISAANIVFSIDVEKKNSYAPDFMLCGLLLSFLVMLIRTINFGISFSLDYFIAYFVFALVFLLMISKFSKNHGKEKTIIMFLSIMALYPIFQIFYVTSIAYYTNLNWMFIRFAETLFFSSYITLIVLNKNNFEEFKEKLKSYKNQIPSFKISLIILIFISFISLGIGGLMKLSEKSSTVTTTQQSVETTTPEPTKEPKENKAKGTVSGGGTEQEKPTEGVTEEENEKKSPKDEIKEIKLDEMQSTEDYDFTLNRVEFSYQVKPDNPPSYYTYYDAPENQVYLYINASVKNKKKQSVDCNEVYSVTADYNGGYTYTGFNIADDTDGDFTYANITTVEPLQTLGVHNLIACPEEIEEAKEPLFIIITLKDGTKFKYTIR